MPRRMLEYIRMEHLEGEWKDVLEVIVKHLDPATRKADAAACLLNSFPTCLPDLSSCWTNRCMEHLY